MVPKNVKRGGGSFEQPFFCKLEKIEGGPFGDILNKTGTSQVGAISKAQKAQNIFLEKNLKFSKKKFLSENVAQCRKM